MNIEVPSGHRFRISATNVANGRFANFFESGVITLKQRPIFSKADVFFTMGSCFAEEIRLSLGRQGLQCVPGYRDIEFDPSVARIDELPKREHMNFYNTFSVRQQIEELLGLLVLDPNDYWTITRRLQKIVPWGDAAFQDPYRRLVFGKTPEDLQAATRGLVDSMRRGFEAATAFVFTFGMTEVFINKSSGLVVSQKPAYGGGGGLSETELHFSSFEENLANVRKIVEMIRSVKPSAPIIMSVSPVPLERTFTGNDVLVVNTESKSILRAVLGQVEREMEGVIYLPSYELVTQLGARDGFKEDGRHVLRPVVNMIIRSFFDAYFSKDVVPVE
jgi:hypothetical protein